MSSRSILAAACAAVLLSAPALADGIVVSARAPSFRNLEYDYDGADRVLAARTALGQAIPMGSSIVGARAVLKQAGARCRDRQPGRMTCASNQFEAVENVLHDVAWTIAVDHDGDTVTGLTIDRTSIGS